MLMKINLTNLFASIATLCMLSSCNSSRIVSFEVTRPAEISLPAEANTILLVDRTKPGNEILNTIEGLLTGELPGSDKVAAQEALMSMKNKLDYSPKFKVKILPGRLIGNSIDASFPQAMNWNAINELCVSNQADIVVCLEVFDSNFIVTNGKRIKKKFTGEGTNKHEIEYNEYFAKGVGNVKIGIRTYFNKNKTIVDQQMINKNNSWEGAGSTPMDALQLLISKSNANKYLANNVGEEYAYKISPLPVTISRYFCSKSKHSDEVETGSRYADVAKWDEAIDVWKRGLSKAGKKDSGILSYNIAVAYEVLGEYGTALSWAQDSYTKYGNKNGRDYVQSLQWRIEEEASLKQQMSK